MKKCVCISLLLSLAPYCNAGDLNLKDIPVTSPPPNVHPLFEELGRTPGPLEGYLNFSGLGLKTISKKLPAAKVLSNKDQHSVVFLDLSNNEIKKISMKKAILLKELYPNIQRVFLGGNPVELWINKKFKKIIGKNRFCHLCFRTNQRLESKMYPGTIIPIFEIFLETKILETARSQGKNIKG